MSEVDGTGGYEVVTAVCLSIITLHVGRSITWGRPGMGIDGGDRHRATTCFGNSMVYRLLSSGGFCQILNSHGWHPEEHMEERSYFTPLFLAPAFADLCTPDIKNIFLIIPSARDVECLIPSPHLLVLATSERFLSEGGIFRAILASQSHWL